MEAELPFCDTGNELRLGLAGWIDVQRGLSLAMYKAGSP